MSIAGSLRTAFADPALVWYRVRANVDAAGLRRRYQRFAHRQGFRRAYFLLSFDCDTDLDIAVVEQVHRRLQDIGVTPVYAVPGELLKRGARAYKAIADTGAEFINHGYRQHTVVDAGTRSYVSTLFYDRLAPEAVAEDIRRGDAAVSELVGRRPTGFRTPHFGTYRGWRRLRFLHSLLTGLGYRFSTSTEPSFGLRLGPAPTLNSGLKEIPVTGCYDEPFRILDSWGFRFAPERRANAPDYLEQARRLARYFNDTSRLGLVNIYADPSQVHDWPEFFEAVGLFARLAVGSFDQLLREIGA